MTQFLDRHGVNCSAIHGGTLRQASTLLENIEYGFNRYSCILLNVGGNDIADGTRPAILAKGMNNLVKQIAKVKPGCLIITAPVIPRFPYKRVPAESGKWFVEMAAEYGQAVRKKCLLASSLSDGRLPGGNHPQRKTTMDRATRG